VVCKLLLDTLLPVSDDNDDHDDDGDDEDNDDDDDDDDADDARRTRGGERAEIEGAGAGEI
jgi:hypothetical protein